MPTRREPIELMLTVDWPDGKGCTSYRETPETLTDCAAALNQMILKALRDGREDGDGFEQPSLLNI